jgi:asparagine synthase (glutamine-hydrolysing)
VHAVEPGCWLEWSADDRTLSHHRYFDIGPAEPTDMSFDDVVDATDQALGQSVRRQLVADVPLGAFLSGGIDSSLMVHYMAQHARGPVRTFSVGFPGMADYDESPAARAVAEMYDTEHHPLRADELTFEQFRRAAAVLDQPLADPALLPTLAISALTRQHVTVAISGDGGDELFGGYARFLETEDTWPDSTWQRLQRRAAAMGLISGKLIRRTLRGQDRVRWRRVRLGPWRRSRKDIRPLLQPDAWRQCEPNHALHRWMNLTLRYRDRMDADALMRSDLWTYLSDNCLAKTDRASMAHALEVRVPMLGNDVVDRVLPLDASMKMPGGNLKAILKALAERYLDRSVWDRPKHGFSVPLRQYFATSWRQPCEALLADCAKLTPFFDERGIRRHWRKVQHGRGDARAMYTMLLMIAWAATHPIDP